jgi:hypothetical protein
VAYFGSEEHSLHVSAEMVFNLLCETGEIRCRVPAKDGEIRLNWQGLSWLLRSARIGGAVQGGWCYVMIMGFVCEGSAHID